MDYSYAHQVIVDTVKTGTEPLGLSLVPVGESWPLQVVRPLDQGLKSCMCQWTNFARREGVGVGLKTEDIACPPCLVAFGLKTMPAPEVYARFMLDAGYMTDRDLALSMAEQLPLMAPGAFQGVVAFPLKQIVWEPDVVWIYGTPAQMSHLVTGLIRGRGRAVPSSTGIGLSCRLGFTDKPCIVIPGRGERVVAGTGETEMFLALPGSMLGDLVHGLLGIKKKRMTAPFAGPMPYAVSLIPALREMSDALVG